MKSITTSPSKKKKKKKKMNPFTRKITHHAQSGSSMRSAFDIFDTISIFTSKPIREQEIK